ncbi:hypothetical protein ASC84_19960 [Acinetobacter sp. Root1280]|uniref:hypothetical protein n=1 Tax=Acinetobacter sp. Root1280 TaxID=1736444 RepID=UPI0006FB9304|nr:hypothetical protein [Acinetobacter sp. Root1280]KQW99767.1 hypothetical protein ASC84_19960 [Acinetobacter sp. Root1280]
MNNYFSLRIPEEKKRLYVLLATVLLVSIICSLLPQPIDNLSQLNQVEKPILKQNADIENYVFTESSWNLPLFVKKVTPPVVKTVTLKPKLELKIAPQTTAIIPNTQAEPSLPEVKYLGQILDSKNKLTFFVKIGDENFIAEPHQVLNETWQVMSFDQNQIVLNYLPYNKLVTIVK